VLEFHVRALGTDGVSDALVGQADIGDVLHLGPPTGSTVHDPSGRDVLLIGGGTGLAPVRALAEEIVTDPDRHATLLFAARTRPELYDLEALYALADRAPGLTLIVAVAEDADFPGVRGTPPDVVAEYGAWTDHDVYVAGPPAMMTATLDR